MVKTRLLLSELATWDELEEDDHNVVRERIANGELPAGFRVKDRRYYIGARARHQYLEPMPLAPNDAGEH